MALITTPTLANANSYVTVDEVDTYFQDRTDITGWADLTTPQKEALIKRATREIDTLKFYDMRYIFRPMYYRDKQALEFPRNTGWVAYSFTPTSATINTVTTTYFQNKQEFFDNFCVGYALLIKDGTGKGQTLEVSGYTNSTGVLTLTQNFTTTPDTTSQMLLIKSIPQDIKDATCEQVLFLHNMGKNNASVQKAKGIKRKKIDDLEEEYFGANESGRSTEVAISSEALGYLQGYINYIGL